MCVYVQLCVVMVMHVVKWAEVDRYACVCACVCVW